MSDGKSSTNGDGSEYGEKNANRDDAPAIDIGHAVGKYKKEIGSISRARERLTTNQYVLFRDSTTKYQ